MFGLATPEFVKKHSIKKELFHGGSGLWLGGLMEDLREQSFTLDKALSGSTDNSFEYLNESYLG